MTKSIGILTAGGDSPGLNAAIRGIGKAAIGHYGMQLVGFRDGFRGLMENRSVRLDETVLSGILNIGGTLLGTSRDKPHRMPVGTKILDMTDAMVETYHKNQLSALVCIGGGGTQKNAMRLMNKGLNIITLPKTIDNDVMMTDVTFGFDTAMTIATDAIDRLHSTAHSHHRIIIVGIMGHNTGWLALAAGIAGGANVILIPEIPYDVGKVTESIRQRSRAGKNFSIVAVAEGAMSKESAAVYQAALVERQQAKGKEETQRAKKKLKEIRERYADNTLKLSKQLEQLTGLESRVTMLGYLQRGGAPSATDRLLATRLGTACADFIEKGIFGIMVAARGEGVEAVPLEQVAGKLKIVPLDHPWIETAHRVGINLGY